MTGSEWVTVDGHELHVAIREGTEPGPPLLLCNGIGASLEVLQPFVDALDPRITAISFDVPGVGGSPLPSGPYRFWWLARLAARLVRQLGHDEFDVLGISWGGALAQQLAFQYPRPCRRVVLVSTGTGMLMVPAAPRVLAKLATPRRYRDPEYAQRVAADLYGGRTRSQPGHSTNLLHRTSNPGPRRGYLYQLLAGLGWSSLPALPLIRQPTLVLAGSDDPIVPLVNARIMTTLLPRARLHAYDDGHLGLITSADDLAPLVSEFLLSGASHPRESHGQPR